MVRNPHATAQSPRTHCFVVLVILVGSVISTGCLRRRMTVRTNPPGATVYVDKQRIGISPASTNYTYYAKRNIELVQDGYRTERFLRNFNPRWYSIPPLDFFTETLWPFEVRDERIIDVQMTPEPVVPSEAFIASAEQLRLQASQGIAVQAPPTVGQTAPIINPSVPDVGGTVPFGLFDPNPPILGPVGQ